MSSCYSKNSAEQLRYSHIYCSTKPAAAGEAVPKRPRPNRPRLGCSRLQLQVARSLELGSFTALPAPAQGLCLSLLSDSPCSSFPGGDDWASGDAISHVFAKPFAGDEHLPGMPVPPLSFCFARRSTPNPNKTICIRIRIQLQNITC